MLLASTYDAFADQNTKGNAQLFETYLNRQQSFVIAWDSPTDGKVSFATVKLPKDWDPEKSYPMYIQLHGLWNVADSPIDYMTYSFRNGPSSTFAYEDGYALNPWGRGNFWYQGISETDIWECIAELKNLVKIDETRQYITGHSMGGYGAWYIASKSAEVWAALGIYAGALWWENEKLLNSDYIYNLRRMPTYFVCGTNDGLLDVDTRAYNLLKKEGNSDIEFVTFVGGHEFLSSNAENMYLWMRGYTIDGYVGVSKIQGENRVSLEVFPNPVGASAKLKFDLPQKSHVNITIYNSDGRLIETLVNETLMQGKNEIDFKSSNYKTGIYNCRMVIGTTHSVYNKLIIK